ncbi:MAG TPA: trypsin-like serine protease [Kineosporiaceae bacterium]
MRSLRVRIPLVGALVVFAVAALMSQPAAPGKAVTGDPATFSTAQVRIYYGGEFEGGGTLVGRSWVLTSQQVVTSTDLRDYTIRFGVVNNAGDHTDQTNVRRMDRVVLPPQGNVVMVHLADPVPENMVIRQLATRPPARFSPLYAFGWGTPEETHDGTVLRMASTIAYDPVATENAAAGRRADNDFAEAFPPSIQPMVIGLETDPLDVGSGIFGPGGILTGVNTTAAEYRHVNETGNLYGQPVRASYEQPVWAYRQWILDTINGAGSSGGSPAPPPRRRLTGAPATGNLPMTPPPQTRLCPTTGACDAPDPGWKPAFLLGAGNYRGTALARCATAAANTCTFGDVPTAPGAAARLLLGPASAPTAPATRQVMVWCKTTTPFPDSSSPVRPVLRVSLTNADPHEVQPGYGWWDITPDQVGPAPSVTGQTPLDTTTLPAC